jgi:hypothetical protein
MNKLSWRWILPLVQIAFAAAALLYAPTRYRHGPRYIGDDSGLVFYRKHYPPPVTRIAYAVNFPAFAATVPVRFLPWWLTVRVHVTREDPLIWLDAEDFVFVCAVGVLWYWVDARIDLFFRRGRVAKRSKKLSTAVVVLGFLFALGVGTLAMLCTRLTDADRPFKQIGPFGLIWAAMLLSYCSWRLLELRRAGTFRMLISTTTE